jgi:hypothetical protein
MDGSSLHPRLALATRRLNPKKVDFAEPGQVGAAARTSHTKFASSAAVRAGHHYQTKTPTGK